MNRFFFRIYLGVLAAAVLGMVLATAVARVPYDLDLLEDHRAYVDTIHPSLVDDLENSPKRDWREVTDWWEGVSEYEIQLRPRDDPFWADKEEFQVPLDDLDELTAELLKLAKLTYSGERLEVERVALSGIFERLIRELEDIAPEVKVTLGGAVQLA